MKHDTCRCRCGRYGARYFQTGKTLLMSSIFMIFTLIFFSADARDTDAQKSVYDEYSVKAAYLYNFAKFVKWPAEMFADPSLPLTICIFGRDPFGSSLDIVKDKTVMGKKLLINRYTRIEELKDCHIMFISPSEEKNLSIILEKVKDMHILTVSDMDGFAQRGGTINLIRIKNKIHFEINIDAAQRSGLQISSRLLQLAKIIKEDHGEGKE